MTTGNRRLIFASKSHTNPILIFFPILIICNDFFYLYMINHWKKQKSAYYHDQDTLDFINGHMTSLASTRYFFGWVGTIFSILIAILYPIRYRVFSDAVLEVDTPFRICRFDHLQSAQKNSSFLETYKRFRWDVATDFKHRVILKRKNTKDGKMLLEVTCSPKDPDAMVRAINEVLQQEQQQQQPSYGGVDSNGEESGSIDNTDAYQASTLPLMAHVDGAPSKEVEMV